jgi:hypothetical protein
LLPEDDEGLGAWFKRIANAATDAHAGMQERYDWTHRCPHELFRRAWATRRRDDVLKPMRPIAEPVWRPWAAEFEQMIGDQRQRMH